MSLFTSISRQSFSSIIYTSGKKTKCHLKTDPVSIKLDHLMSTDPVDQVDQLTSIDPVGHGPGQIMGLFKRRNRVR